MASTLLVMPQLDIETRFQILSGESQALRNLDVHFLPIALQRCLLLLPVCVFMQIFCIVIILLSDVVCVISEILALGYTKIRI